ncbi:MAG: hypothetical protein KF703_18525 [Actinobacteria bacterium]|nr:hypothetical protein [Actinomycetota bacterium]
MTEVTATDLGYAGPAPPPERPRDPATAPLEPATTLEWVALALALAPILVVVGWALSTGWQPLGDSAQIVVRSRDVLTQHHPFLGAWSSSSQDVGQDLNNLGPLYVDLIAPFTKVTPWAGAAIGIGLVNAASVVGVWAVARRLFGPTGSVGAMAATVALEASMGSQALLEARQQIALLLPFWCLLWVAVALWDGRAWALPVAVFLGSLVVQTHFTFVYQALIVLALATVAYVRRRGRRGRARSGREMDAGITLGWTAIVALVCWVQPLWDQFFGLGNLGKVLGAGGGDDAGTTGAASLRPGLGGGVELVSRTSLRPPFWFPGSLGSALGDEPLTGRVHATATGWLTVAAWALALAAVAWWARRHDRRPLGALAGVALVALAASVVAASLIPPAAFTVLPPQNYYWMWPVGLLLSVTVVAGAVAVATEHRASAEPVVLVAAAAALGALALVTVRPASSLAYVDREANREQAAARILDRRFDAALDRSGLEGPVVVDFDRDLDFSTHRYSFLAELQSRGIEFTFDARTADLRRFGDRRCERGKARYRLFVLSGGALGTLEEGQLVLARTREVTTGVPVGLVLQAEPRPTPEERAAMSDRCRR